MALGPLLDLGSGVEGTRIYHDGFACLVRADHPRILGDRIDLDAYLECAHLVISPTGRGGSLVDSHLGERTRRTVAEVESFLLAPSIVAQTDLVLTAPRSALEHATHTHTVRVVSAPFELPAVQIAAYWDASRSDDPRVLWILESVRQSLGQEQV